jgi:hypothetical protein
VTIVQFRGSESIPDNLWERRGEDQRGYQTTSEGYERLSTVLFRGKEVYTRQPLKEERLTVV